MKTWRPDRPPVWRIVLGILVIIALACLPVVAWLFILKAGAWHVPPYYVIDEVKR